MVVVAVVAVIAAAATLVLAEDEQALPTRHPVDGEMGGGGRGEIDEGGENQAHWIITEALTVGDCLEIEVGGDEVDTNADMVPISCDEPHRSELYAELVLGDEDAEYPGEAAVEQERQALCYGDGFLDYVGVPYDESMLWQTSLYPSEATWAGGNRELACFVHGPEPTEPTTGSFRGSGI